MIAARKKRNEKERCLANGGEGLHGQANPALASDESTVAVTFVARHEKKKTGRDVWLALWSCGVGVGVLALARDEDTMDMYNEHVQ